jgi:hypothetical protein
MGQAIREYRRYEFNQIDIKNTYELSEVNPDFWNINDQISSDLKDQSETRLVLFPKEDISIDELTEQMSDLFSAGL